MTYGNIKRGQIVKDTWFDNWGKGRVIVVMKTVVKIAFYNKGVITYDKGHLKYLKLVCEV